MPIGKDKPTRRIDKPAAFTGGASVEESTPDFAPPAVGSIAAPTGLVLDSFIGRSSAAPTAYISATWNRPYGTDPQSYVVQVSLSNTFPDGTTTTYATQTESATLDGLKPNTTYYVRVAAVYRLIQSGWSATVSELTPNDTTPAAQPTGLAGAWIGTGDLRVTFTPPTDDNYKDVELRIFASNGGALLHTEYNRIGNYIYPVALNLQETSGAGDPSLYVIARSRTFSNVLNSTSPPTLTTTKAAPSAPTLTQSWTGDTGTAGADLKFSWTAIADAAYYPLTLNGLTAQRIGSTVYTYTVAHNQADNTTPDPTITYGLKSVDGLGQQSTNVSGTATNAAPVAPTATLEQGAVSGLHATVTSTPPADFDHYVYTFKRDGAGVVTVSSPAATCRYEMQGAADVGFHSWTCEVRQYDAFGQSSAIGATGAVAFEALTLVGLRAQARYTDSTGASEATLAVLKDGVTTTGGISYAA